MAETFIDKFNRLLGDRAGIHRDPVPISVNKGIKQAAMVSGKVPNWNPPKPKVRKNTTGMTADQKAFTQLMKDTMERKAVEDALEDTNPVEDALGAIGSGFLKGAGAVFRRTEAFAAEPYRRVAQSIGAGEPGYSMLDDLVTGAISGAVHGDTTWGETVEEAAKNSPQKVAKSIGLSPWAGLLTPAFLGAGANNLAKTNPDLAQKYKQGAGFFGTVVLDPLNVVGGKAVSVLARSGEELTEAGIREFVEDAAKTAAKKHLPANTGSVSVKQGSGLGNTFVGAAKKVGADSGEAAGKLALEVTGGAQAGKIKWSNKVFTPIVANQTGEAYRGVRLSRFERNLNKWIDYVSGTGKPLSMNAINRMATSDPEFHRFLQNVIDAARASRPQNAPRSLDDVIVMLQGYQPEYLATTIKNSADAVRASIADEVAGFMDEFSSEISKFAYNAPGIRIRGLNKSMPFRRVGRAYAEVKDVVGSRLGGVTNPLSFEGQFPGRLSILAQKVRSMGVKPFEELKRSVEAIAKPFSKEQRVMIADALDSGTVMVDPAMEQARQFLRTKYDELIDEEIGMGTRRDSEHIDDYAFVFNRGGTVKARRAFKEARRTSIRNTKTTAGFRRADARKLGLRPEDDPFKALLLRKADSNRSLTRAWFREDLLNNYGLMTRNLSDAEVTRRALHPYDPKDLPVQLQNAMHPQDTWYLPKEMHQLYNDFKKLTEIGSAEGTQLGRIFDNLTNKFKFLATVPNTGFHIRNMIGDIYMGFLDGVKSKTYTEVFNKIALHKAGKNVRFKIGAGLELSYDELDDLYMRHAAGSRFYSADLPGGGVNRLPGRVGGWLRDKSQGREDFGRLVHFLHALRQEYPNAVKVGKKNALERATEAAVYRVNKYKFDYSALTAVEHQIKRVVPFYTYSRKAIPTLMEAFFLSPRWMGRTYKMFNTQQGQNYENFNDMLVPDYMREIGYATLTDEEEPWAIGGGLVPSFPGVSKLSLSNRQSFASSVIAQLNPMLKAIPELSSGRYSFNQRPIGSNLEYLENQIPTFSGYQQWQNEGKGFWEKLISNRLGGAGLPISKITQGQQDFAYEEQRDRLIDEPFREFNQANEGSGIRVYLSKRNDGTDFQVKDTVTGAILYTSVNPEEALEFANRAAKAATDVRGNAVPEEEPFSRKLFNQLTG